nr:hypothetical protein [uncultured Mediterranean phage uvMED]|tara:strand:- start:4546 stop:4917 length:372 start_codon:yes stop_codon:yes gene_type:complete
MSLFDKLTAKNFAAYAMKHYDDPQCEDMEDFYEDIRRFRYLKRLLYRYYQHGELRERLMLNHIICIFNVFGFEPSMRMLKFKIKDKEYWSSIKTLLVYLKYVDEGFEVDVPIDETLASTLRKV